MDRRRLFQRLRREFRLDWTGIHGPSHWARVRRIGLDLAPRTGADRNVVEAFALLHDARRWNDGRDPEHGARAAALALELRGELVHLEGRRMELLLEALREHSDGRTEADVTVATCWDADRLDLARVGIEPDPRYLCTVPARDPEFLRRAVERSRRWVSWALGMP